MKLTIIGAGPGGYETAVAAAARGVEVTIISDGPVGGACLNEGCIPTKCFCRNAQILDDLGKASVFGVENLSYNFDFHKVVSRKDEVVAGLRSGVEFLLKGKGITLLYGKASFKDACTVLVRPSDGGEAVEVSSDYIIVATGSTSASLPIPGAELCISSREALSMESVPARLCVIGGGVIGLELSSVFRSFGSEVCVLEFCKEILPRFDSDLSKRLKQAISKRGISIETLAQVTAVSKSSEGGFRVSYTRKGVEASVEADAVLMAVGRRPNISSLNFDKVGVEAGPKGVKVDADMRTNVPNIFAIGDIAGGYMLAHTAVFQGRRALDTILGEPSTVRLDVVPAAVFTRPEAATVGLSEEECKEKGLQIRCLKSFFRANGKAVSMDEPEGFVKLVVSAENGEILGCHMFGEHSADIVQEVAALICKAATLKELQGIIHAHPTLSEVIQEASRA